MRKSAAKKRAVTASLVTQSAQSLTDKAYGQLEEMIVTLRLAPGRAVSESELSRHLGIGRTPIREALQRLAREHLVTILPRRGIIVSAVNPSNQLRLLEVRRELERLIARSAARRCSDAERGRFRELAKLFETSARTDDEVTFMRVDREFNELCSRTAHNEFAASTMLLLHSLSRRFWFIRRWIPICAPWCGCIRSWEIFLCLFPIDMLRDWPTSKFPGSQTRRWEG